MKDPTFAAEYTQARAEIDAVDGLIRALEQARERSRLTKADLARRIDAKPEIVRRLLTDTGGNPTMSTVLKMASALGCHLELVPNSGRRVVHRSAAARTRRAVFGDNYSCRSCCLTRERYPGFRCLGSIELPLTDWVDAVASSRRNLST